MEKVTEFEKEALRLLYDGLSAKEIGRRLDIAERTVYQRLTRATHKMGADRPLEAARFLANAEGRRPYAETAHQSLHVANTVIDPHHWLVRLLMPEATGSTFNDLTTRERFAVASVRTVLIALTLLAVVALVREVSLILSWLR